MAICSRCFGERTPPPNAAVISRYALTAAGEFAISFMILGTRPMRCCTVSRTALVSPVAFSTSTGCSLVVMDVSSDAGHLTTYDTWFVDEIAGRAIVYTWHAKDERRTRRCRHEN